MPREELYLHDIIEAIIVIELKSFREQIAQILQSDFPDFEYKPKT